MSSRRLPATVILLSLTSLVNDAGTEMIFPLLPVFLVGTLGASPAYLGLIEGAADAVSSLLKLVAGWISDRVGRRKPLVLFGYGLASAVRPLVGFATAPWQVLAIRVSDRVGKGVRASPRDALIADSVDESNAGRAFGFHQAMDHAGAVIGPLVATGLLAVGITLRHVFLLAIIPGAIATVVVLFVRDSPMPETPKGARAGFFATFAKLPPRLKSYLAILTVFSLGNSSDAFLLLRAKDLGVATALLPILWSVFHVAKVGSAFFGGGAADRMPRVRLILIGWGVYAVTYLGFGFAKTTWQVWALFVVYGVYYGLTEPVEKALVRDLAPAELRGGAFGAYNFVVGASALPAGLLTGWLWQAYGPAVALGVGGVVSAVAGAFLLAWGAKR
jgi:MFS family permease